MFGFTPCSSLEHHIAAQSKGLKVAHIHLRLRTHPNSPSFLPTYIDIKHSQSGRIERAIDTLAPPRSFHPQHELPLHRRRAYKSARHSRRDINALSRPGGQRKSAASRTRAATTQAARFRSHPIADTPHPTVSSGQVAMAAAGSPTSATRRGRSIDVAATARFRYKGPAPQSWSCFENARTVGCRQLCKLASTRLLLDRRRQATRLSSFRASAQEQRHRQQLAFLAAPGLQTCAALPHYSSCIQS